ncbi:CAP domain-containing protein [Flavobacterium sp. SOK18b]|uniref:CAP domain-containing protein n=1 Tax=Flavobacterium TaxID=237 RepID=UPI0011A9C243|nr:MULTISPECIES: CAP domain-containing protein [Flavobacterium]MBB1193367.1 CAP domain-containing protein [Flavobacterium sp. SOK18b]
MTTKLLRTLLLSLVVCISASCSSNSSDEQTNETTVQKVSNYNYSVFEIETMDLINSYRVSKGLNPLLKINHMSFKSEEHDNYMIENNVVNHNNFVERSENIIQTLGAKSVSENVAYNYSTPQSVLNAWLASPGHKAVIEGNFTHFGLAVKEHPTTGRKYFTNLFARI